MSNRLVLDLQARAINPDLDRLYYDKVPFLLGNYLVGLLEEAGVPSEEWYQRVTEDLHAFNQQQLDGAVFGNVIEGSARSCVENHLKGRGFLFAKIKREGLTSTTHILKKSPRRAGKPKPRKGALRKAA